MRTLILATSDSRYQGWRALDLASLRAVSFQEARARDWHRAAAVFLDEGCDELMDQIPPQCEAPVLAVAADPQRRLQLEERGAFEVFSHAPDQDAWRSALARTLRLARAERRVQHLRKLNQRRRRQMRDLWRTGEIVREMTSTLYIEDILRSILHGVQRHLSLDRVMLGLINGESKCEEIKVALGIDRAQLEEAAWAVDDSSPVWTQIARRGAPLLVDTEEEKALPPFLRRIFPKGFVKAPLIVRKQILGTVMCDRSQGQIGPRDLRLLKVFCQYAAIAIQNARLYYDVLKSEEELRQAHDKLVKTEKMALIGQMAVSINHEINNPLCNISLVGQMISDELDEVPERVEKLLTDMADNIERIQKVTRKLSGLKDAPLTEYLPNQMMVDLQ